MFQYYMFHKPAGFITAKRDEVHPVVMDFFKDLNNEKLNPVGRLDKDTEGLLLVTDDGQWNQRLMAPNEHVSKTYYFWAYGELTDEGMESISKGMMLKGQSSLTRPAKIEKIRSCPFDELPAFARVGDRYRKLHHNPNNNIVTEGMITLTEGKKHQVKRMLKGVGCYVIYLKRIAIGNLELDEALQPGEYRELTEEEMSRLK